MRRQLFYLAILCGMFTTGAATTQSATMIYDGVLFGYPLYDYAPSVMIEGGQAKAWGSGAAGGFPGDVIGYSTAPIGGAWSTPVAALWGTPVAGAWDEIHTCDPNVVKGSFVYGGTNYSYAMYYAGHANSSVVYTQIGVAFSNDGVNWVKGPNPIVTPAGPPDPIYGAGTPTFYRSQGTASSGYLVWWDSTWPGGPRNVYATTADGVNFGARQLLDTSIRGSSATSPSTR